MLYNGKLCKKQLENVRKSGWSPGLKVVSSNLDSLPHPLFKICLIPMFKNSPRICFFFYGCNRQRVTFNLVPYSSLRLYNNSNFHVVHTLETVEYSWAAFTNAAGKHTRFLPSLRRLPHTFWIQEHVKNVLQLATYLSFLQNETNKGSKGLWTQ